jgi:hypothetical protein
LAGSFFETGFKNTAASAVHLTDDGDFKREPNASIAYYVHQFNFAQTAQIAIDDTYYNAPTRNWENLEFNYLNTEPGNDKVLKSVTLELDSESS